MSDLQLALSTCSNVPILRGSQPTQINALLVFINLKILFANKKLVYETHYLGISCTPPPFQNIHNTTNETCNKQESSRNHEAHVVIHGRLKYPAWE